MMVRGSSRPYIPSWLHGLLRPGPPHCLPVPQGVCVCVCLCLGLGVCVCVFGGRCSRWPEINFGCLQLLSTLLLSFSWV